MPIVPRPYFTIGVNKGFFLYPNQLDENATSIDNIYLASEMIGLKLKFYDWKYVNSFQPGETCRAWEKDISAKTPVGDPLFSDIYVSLYTSGILYNVANLKIKKDFNTGFVRANLAFTFFNGLNFNVSYAIPFNNNLYKAENSFISLSFDIPLIDYISAARKKK